MEENSDYSLSDEEEQAAGQMFMLKSSKPSTSGCRQDGSGKCHLNESSVKIELNHTMKA